mgnify:CR=1 FL=1
MRREREEGGGGGGGGGGEGEGEGSDTAVHRQGGGGDVCDQIFDGHHELD